MTIDEIDSLKLTRLLSDTVANDDDALQRSNLISIAKCIDELQIRLDQTKNIVVFASPKSASTFLARNLQTILGFKWHPLTFSYFENEHDLHLPYLVTAQRENKFVPFPPPDCKANPTINIGKASTSNKGQLRLKILSNLSLP